MIMNKDYPGEPVHIHIQPLIHILCRIKLANYHYKRVRVNYHLFCGNGELVFSIYGLVGEMVRCEILGVLDAYRFEHSSV